MFEEGLIKCTHVDLFSGIGGFAYAAKQTWGGAYENILFCDNNKFCQEVIKKNFGKESLIYGDIREITRGRVIADTNRIRLQKHGKEQQASRDRQLPETTTDAGGGEPRGVSGSRREEISSFRKVYLLTGGFPCQPFSAAGKRSGTKDNRYLWPEMLRVIKEFKPTWIIGENVAGILTMAQQQGDAQVGSETDLFGNKTNTLTEYGRGVVYGIIADLEQIGYSVQPFVIPACAVNAPHRRDRIWIVAYAGCKYGERVEVGREPSGALSCQKTTPLSERSISDDTKGVNPHASSSRRLNGSSHRQGGQVQGIAFREDEKDKQERNRRKCRISERGGDASYSKTERLQRSQQADGEKRKKPHDEQLYGCNREWSKGWFEVATELCGVDDGLPAELDGFKLSKSGHRVERLKALGNAIVPQVAIEIMEAIKQCH
jgi:DNA (cytosine-5)-methyltransferase 1